MEIQATKMLHAMYEILICLTLYFPFPSGVFDMHVSVCVCQSRYMFRFVCVWVTCATCKLSNHLMCAQFRGQIENQQTKTAAAAAASIALLLYMF